MGSIHGNLGDEPFTLEAATLPIRGQEEKSAFGAMAANPTAMPSVAGEWKLLLLVSSQFESCQSSTSTRNTCS